MSETIGVSGKIAVTTTETVGVPSYVVLRKHADPGGWAIENSNVPAASAEAAIRLACKNDDKPEGTYVAVPVRSWKPVTVKAEKTVTLKIEDAK